MFIKAKKYWFPVWAGALVLTGAAIYGVAEYGQYLLPPHIPYF